MENSDWYDYIVAGIQYLKTAFKGQSRPEVFTNELTYNLITLSMEKLLVGLALYHGKPPNHHCLGSLAQEVAKVEPMRIQMMKNIQTIADYQDLCSLEVGHLKIPNDIEIGNMLAAAKKVESFVKQSIERRYATSVKTRNTLIHFTKAYAKENNYSRRHL
jgi:hypothetical protein